MEDYAVKRFSFEQLKQFILNVREVLKLLDVSHLFKSIKVFLFDLAAVLVVGMFVLAEVVEKYHKLFPNGLIR